MACVTLPTLRILHVVADSSGVKTSDRWFVLEAPEDLKAAASSTVSDVKATRHTEQQQLSEVEQEKIILEEVSEGRVMLKLPRENERNWSGLPRSISAYSSLRAATSASSSASQEGDETLCSEW